MQKTINGATFRRMVNAANIYLETNKKYIDSLNVFPVQDGDTGANCLLLLSPQQSMLMNVLLTTLWIWVMLWARVLCVVLGVTLVLSCRRLCVECL